MSDVIRTFEAPTFFTIGFVASHDEAEQLCSALPPIYRKIGHFAISSIKDRFGWYEVKWECHKLPSSMPLVELPFRVVTIEDISRNKGLPIPTNFPERG